MVTLFIRGGSRISLKGVLLLTCVCVCVGGRFVDFILFFLNIHENELIWSHCHRIFKNGGGEGGVVV